MKILILTGAFGMGHYSASEAVKEEILIINPEADIEIIDMIEYIYPKTCKMIYIAFNLMISKFSFVYNFFSKITARRAEMPLKRSMIKRLDLLLEEDVNMIISTFPTCTQYISSYKKTENIDIPLYTYITDIGVNEEWLGEETNMYFVGSAETKSTLISKGVEEDKIIVSGIPVKKCFKSNNYSNNIKKEEKEILIMGGGLGLMPFCEELLDKLTREKDIKITFIAGKNDKLLNKIKEKYPNVDSIGYTNKVEYYMRRADLVITKSGGVTLFEAIHCHIPLYVIRPFLSQEVGNARFIQNHHIGKVVWSKGTDVCEDVISLIKNNILLSEMKKNIEALEENLEHVCPLTSYDEGDVELCY